MCVHMAGERVAAWHVWLSRATAPASVRTHSPLPLSHLSCLSSARRFCTSSVSCTFKAHHDCC